MAFLGLKNPWKATRDLFRGDFDPFERPEVPAAPTAVPLAAPTSQDDAVKRAAEEERMRLAKAKGRQSTILSGLGEGTTNQNVQIKTLLGG